MYNKLFKKHEYYRNKNIILTDMVREKESIINLQKHQLNRVREKIKETLKKNNLLETENKRLQKENQQLIETVLDYEKKERRINNEN